MRFSSTIERLSGMGGAKWRVHHRARQRKLAGDDIVMLTIGEPDVDAPAEVVDATVASLQGGATGYTPGRGMPNFLDALARHYSQRTGRTIDPSQIMALPGTQAGLFVAMTAVAEAGDEVVVPDPYYATYDGVIATTGASMVHVELSPDDGYHLRPERLEAAITPKTTALLLNSPHNPTGATLSAEEIGAIGEICRAHDLWIVADEVYAHYPPDGRVAASAFDVDELAERTLVSSSLSKSHAMPGFRMGWLVASREASAAILPVAESMMFGSQPFLQEGAAVALNGDWRTVADLRVVFAERARRVSQALDGVAGISCPEPEAGMFVVANVRSTGMSGDQFAERLLDEVGVAVMPGESFGDYGHGLIRISVTVPDADIDAACERLRSFATGLAAASPTG